MTNVLVIFGGKSSEHDVSLMSTTSVIRAMDKYKYRILPLYIDRDGNFWQYEGSITEIINAEVNKSNFSPIKLNRPMVMKDIEGSIFEGDIDIAFPVLHGPHGEDGSIQGYLETLGLPYVGSGVLSSALCMDKLTTKTLLKGQGIPQVEFVGVLAKEISDMDSLIAKIESKLKYPIFVKPSNQGSSIGVRKAKHRNALKDALIYASLFDLRIIAEEGVEGLELECSILGNHEPIASIVGSLIPSREFYDYKAKYLDGDSSELQIPAPIDLATSNTVRELAIKAYEICGCSGMARVDFFLVGDKVLLSEINTIPGFTSISMYPKLFEHSGIDYSRLIDMLIGLGIDRYIERQALLRVGHGE